MQSINNLMPNAKINSNDKGDNINKANLIKNCISKHLYLTNSNIVD